MQVGFRLVDVFSPRPYEGNQLCVVPDPVDLDDASMLSIAREIGFAETTYVTERGADGYAMRIFTPTEELPFAGHPTLGTAFVLASEGRIGRTAIQRVRAGEVPVEVDVEAGFAWMTQLPPVFGPELGDRALAARAAGLSADDLDPELPVQTVSTGLPVTLVPVRDLDTLRRARRDRDAVARTLDVSGADVLYLFARPGDDGVTARMFDADLGIGEDPATGAAAGPLGVYLARRGLVRTPARFMIRQGEQVGRPSELHVEVSGDGTDLVARVGGGVHVIGHGAFER